MEAVSSGGKGEFVSSKGEGAVGKGKGEGAGGKGKGEAKGGKVQWAARQSEVQFFHSTNEELWSRQSCALQSIADVANSEGLPSTHDFLRTLVEIRALKGGSKPIVSGLRKALDAAPQKGLGSAEDFLSQVGRMALWALQLPLLFDSGLPICGGTNPQVHLTRAQCAALISASLFGVLPEGSSQATTSFSMAYILQAHAQKCLCLLAYLRRVACGTDEFLGEVVSFKRREASPLGADFWREMKRPLQPFTVGEQSSMAGRRLLHADFANKNLGGGALMGGDVQEEILFAKHPECWVGMLLCRVILPGEAILIAGVHCYSCCTGYGRSFAFARPCTSEAEPPDAWGRRGSHLTAFDALEKPGDAQFGGDLVRRELRKAYAACLGDPDEPPETRVFATGNWGCGQFGGDPQLKSLIQWIAASAAGRQVLYAVHGDARVGELARVTEAISAAGLDCAGLYRLLMQACASGAPGLEEEFFGRIMTALDAAS